MTNIIDNRQTGSDNDKGDLVFYIFLILAILLGAMIGSGLALFAGSLFGFSPMEGLGDVGTDPSLNQRNYLRIANGLSHLFTFTVAALAFASYFYGAPFWQKLGFRRPVRSANAGLGILIMMVSFPFIQLLYYLNRQLPLPDALTQMEASAENMLQAVLTMNSPWELLLNLVVVALLPAVGEELIFRGLLQKRLERYFQKGYLAVWVTALIFSAIHLQFEGFLPRMFLGAVLGYLFYWSRNLWIPIFAHFIFNGMQVVGQYFYAEEMEKLELAESLAPNWALALFSLAGVLALSYYFIGLNRQTDKEEI
ncbi:MAG TPA: type II CAAX endopeptidase family protein [Saprospiraceae bacterium]|nr:type II CAAX endopeptidase family protein [Saprospiraceae bacterium]